MKNKFDFQPKLFTALRNYSKERFMTDLMAGIIVGIVALPLAIAFGIASGVSPEKGLITAIIGGFIVSLLGGCNVQIGGPTGAFIVIVYGIIQNFGIEGLAIATVIAGIILVLMGVLKLGTVIKFIPYPIVVGFTSGIAITIFTTQMKDLFGLTMDKVPADFISKWIAYFVGLLEGLSAFHESGSAGMRAIGVSIPPAVLTVIGSVCFRILWVLYVLPLNPTYLMLMLVYPASWIVTGAVMQLACHRYMGKLGR